MACMAHGLGFLNNHLFLQRKEKGSVDICGNLYFWLFYKTLEQLPHPACRQNFLWRGNLPTLLSL